jgi:pimeloyl-ACP methyl ester carboxylesterase
MDALLDDAVAVIDECGLGKPVVAGHSWGATVALELAGTRAESVSGLVFIDGPVQSASSLFSWEEGQKFMQPPLPRFQSMTEARADAREEIESVWGDDLEPFVEARVIADGDALVLTLTAPVRLALLRGLYDSQPDVLWPRLTVPVTALLAREASAVVSSWKEKGAALLAESAPQVKIKWFDTPHDIPLYAPAEVAAEIAAVSWPKNSEAAAG